MISGNYNGHYFVTYTEGDGDESIMRIIVSCCPHPCALSHSIFLAESASNEGRMMLKKMNHTQRLFFFLNKKCVYSTATHPV